VILSPFTTALAIAPGLGVELGIIDKYRRYYIGFPGNLDVPENIARTNNIEKMDQIVFSVIDGLIRQPDFDLDIQPPELRGCFEDLNGISASIFI
jgi:hypothetical protein